MFIRLLLSDFCFVLLCVFRPASSMGVRSGIFIPTPWFLSDGSSPWPLDLLQGLQEISKNIVSSPVDSLVMADFCHLKFE